MFTRRQALALAAGAALSPTIGRASEGFELPEPYRAAQVRVRRDLQVGSIHVISSRHQLYLVTERGRALRYGVGVGREGLAFRGTAVVGRKAEWPSWRPTNAMIERSPGLYSQWADGMPGGPENPLGARALYLYQDGRDTQFRIHGTNRPDTIGSSVSNGCIRMTNSHVTHLYDRVPVGAQVTVY